MFPRFHCAYICFWALRLNQSYNECITSFYFFFFFFSLLSLSKNVMLVSFYLILWSPSPALFGGILYIVPWWPIAQWQIMLAYTSIYFYKHVPIHGFVLFFARNDNYLPMLDRINGPSRFNLSQPKVLDGSKRIPELSSLLCSQFTHQEDFFHYSRAIGEQTISFLKLFE